MVEYKLTVVKKVDCKYLISHYDKSEPEEVPDFPSLVNKILSYYEERLELFGREPTIICLPEEEEIAVRKLRRLVIDKTNSDILLNSLKSSPF